MNPGQAINAVTKLAFGVLSFHFLERFWGYFAFLFYPTAATVIRLLLCNSSYTAGPSVADYSRHRTDPECGAGAHMRKAANLRFQIIEVPAA